jgi:RNA 3'-terminal phosphate cyclase
MRVVDEEALDAIVLAMVLHGECFKVQECACQVLLQLAIMENFKAMQASNIGELVRVAAERFPQNYEPVRLLRLKVLLRIIRGEG